DRGDPHGCAVARAGEPGDRPPPGGLSSLRPLGFLKTGFPEFTNEVQHFFKGVLLWGAGSTAISRSRNAARLPGVARPVSRSGKSRQLWIARHRALLGS